MRDGGIFAIGKDIERFMESEVEVGTRAQLKVEGDWSGYHRKSGGSVERRWHSGDER